jgi:S-DNA-T family DNA segregation ATPase FtsK/SpoIIIE
MGEDSGINLDVDISERDTLFREAWEYCQRTTRLGIIVTKKTKTRFNRAGRLIDQLEAAGIVGPFEGSKARGVHILDMSALDQFLTMNKIINTMKNFILITFILLLAFTSTR